MQERSCSSLSEAFASASGPSSEQQTHQSNGIHADRSSYGLGGQLRKVCSALTSLAPGRRHSNHWHQCMPARSHTSSSATERLCNDLQHVLASSACVLVCCLSMTCKSSAENGSPVQPCQCHLTSSKVYFRNFHVSWQSYILASS